VRQLNKNMNHNWIEYSDHISQCSKCSAKKFKEPNHGDYISVYYTNENPFGSLDIPKCNYKKFHFQFTETFLNKIALLPSINYLYGRTRGGYIISIEWLWFEVSITILK
jgi:hypothetical protein